MTAVFVDTSAFYALADAADQNHRRARTILRSLSRARRPLVTSTYVLNEAVTLVRYRLGHAAAVTLGSTLIASRWCRLIDIGEDLRRAGWEIFVKHADQSFSFTDCTSFALMRAMGLAESFTFDQRDFSAAGFATLQST